MLRPDEPLLPLGVEDAAGEGREDVPVGVGVDEGGVTPQRSLGRQRELAVGVVEHRDVVVGLGGGEGVAGLAQFLADPGDLVLGAEDGALVVPANVIDDVIVEAYEKSQKESKVRTALRQGMSASEAFLVTDE